MNSDRWKKARELYEGALGLGAAERVEYLAAHCSDDAELRAEVESLLESSDGSEDFLESPVIAGMAETLIRQTEMVGRKFRQYEIMSAIGAGGMGEVFLARDTNLKRNVALKFLPHELTDNPDYLRRFEREARAASALNHPGILTIHELGVEDGTHFIVTEYVDGVNLRNHLKSDARDLRELVAIAIQIASALSAAHDAGIIHRDIKPENIMIRRDRIVKILDFGLAKLAQNNDGNADLGFASPRPAAGSVVTRPGMILGTPNYMSPEQARGLELDRRSDVFSFGVVLYEMLAGRLPFRGETTSDVIAAILTRDPEPLAGNGTVPEELEAIVRRALAKEKDGRYDDLHQLLSELQDVADDLKSKEWLERSSIPNVGEARTAVLGAETATNIEHTAAATAVTGDRGPRRSLVAVLGLLAVLIGGGFFGYRYFSSGTQIDSVAVMPFFNEGGNPELEYLSDGMTESLIKGLSNIPNLNVKARSSVFRYKGKDTDLKTVAAELGVQAVVTGKIIQRGDEITLSLDLVEASSERNLWNERYTRKQSELVSLQNEIARDVTNNLRLKLSGAETARVTNSGTNNPEAYQAYLKGRYFMTRATNDSPKEALSHFQEAVAKDPKFALGYAGIADSYTLIGTVMQTRTKPEEVIPLARTAAEKAIELDPNLSEAYVSLAWIKFRYDWNWAAAEQDFRKAIELNPKNAQAHQWYGEFLAVQRRDEEALVSFRKSVELEPFNVLMQWNYAKSYGDFGRSEECLREIKRVYEMDRSFRRTYRVLRVAYARLGMESEAFETFIQEIQVNNLAPEKIEVYRALYKEKGYRPMLDSYIRNELIAAPETNASAKATYYAALEDKENTLRWLEEAYQQRLGGVLYCRFAQYDFLKDDPRYQAFLRKLNFPDLVGK